MDILTLFNYNKNVPMPLMSLVVDGDKASFHKFFVPHSGLVLRDIKENIENFKKLFSRKLNCNDFLTHLLAFDFELDDYFEVYDYCLPQLKIPIKNEEQARSVLLKIMPEVITDEFEQWRKLIADSSVVYAALQKRGVVWGYKRFPKYSLETLTSRSKTTGFNIQGQTADIDIRHVRPENNVFVCFDWISADICMAAHMSKDERLLDSFNTSDPYTVIADYLDSPDFGRDECKNLFIRNLYAMNFDDEIFGLFPEFRSWMISRRRELQINGEIDTILGRKFVLDGRKELSVFNAQFQGSVVHAMQSVLVRVFDLFPEYLLTEVHDALILCCPEKVVSSVIKDVSDIMLHPFDNLDVRMPHTINIGLNWKGWVKHKTRR